jgi:hypothetical protein
MDFTSDSQIVGVQTSSLIVYHPLLGVVLSHITKQLTLKLGLATATGLFESPEFETNAVNFSGFSGFSITLLPDVYLCNELRTRA